MAVIETWFEQDLNKAVKVQYLDGNVFSADNLGNKVGVRVYQNGQAATLSGTISANIIRSDGGTVAVTGTFSGNEAYIVLPQAAYAVPGVISIVIKNTVSSVVTTLCAVVAVVYESTTSTAIDPGTIIPSIQTLITEMETVAATIPASYTDLWTKLAPAFSTNTSYVAGQYVTYNEGLYRFTTTHSGAWSSGDVVAVNLGSEVTDLKSAFNTDYDNITEETYALMDFQNLFAYTVINDAAVTIDGDKVTVKSLSNKAYCIAELVIPVPANTSYLRISYEGYTGNGYGCVRIGSSADGTTYSWNKAMTNASGDAYNLSVTGKTHIKVGLYVSFSTAASVNDYVTYNKLMVCDDIYGKPYKRARNAFDPVARENANNNSEIIGTNELIGKFPNDAYYNYFNNELSVMDGAGMFSMTDRINLTGVTKIKYKLYKYASAQYSRAFAYLVFFDDDSDLVQAITEYTGTDITGTVVTGEMAVPVGAKYVVASKIDNQDQYIKLEYVVCDLVSKHDDQILKYEDEINTIDGKTGNIGEIYGYTKKINLIGDSITQGVGVADPDNDSYAGIMRKMMFIENDMKMNWGFESFTAKADIDAEYKMVTATRNGFNRLWNGTTCYGSDEMSSSTVGAYISFTIRDKFNYMKVSYKDGVTGSFGVYAGDTLLTTVTVSSGTAQAALTDAIDISAYDPGTVYKVVVVSGTVTVSGVELGYDTSYPTFNNYGRAGIPISTVTGTLLTKESTCDILIYALGVNGTVSASDLASIAQTIESASPGKIIVLCVCMKSTEKNNTAKIPVLKDFADGLGATFINMYSIIPKDGSGNTDTSFFDVDGVHPSALGHRCIADKISKVMALSAQSTGMAQKVFGDWGS